jgi:thioredoxin 1
MLLIVVIFYVLLVCNNAYQLSSSPSSIIYKKVNRINYSNIILKGSIIQNILTADELDSITTKNTEDVLPVVIDFQKSKCAPCLKVAPLYEALAKRYEGKARFFKVDADSSPEALSVMKANGIRSVPTFHVWRLGTRIDSIQGSHIDEVEALIEGELQKMKG